MTKNRILLTLFVFLFSIGMVAGWLVYTNRSIPPPAPLAQHLYIWNRAWNRSMGESIHQASSKASRLVVLASQIDKVKRDPVVKKIPVDYTPFHDPGIELGLAIRVSSLPVSATQVQAFHQAVKNTAVELIQAVSHEHLILSELQIDYDCPEAA